MHLYQHMNEINSPTLSMEIIYLKLRKHVIKFTKSFYAKSEWRHKQIKALRKAKMRSLILRIESVLYYLAV